MKRIAEEHLVKWFFKTERLPLIIRGARQVGKSTLVRLFCEAQKIELLEVNLERVRLKTLDEEEFSINELLDEIQLKTKKVIGSNTLIFFDEIQESPKLLKFLRYFYEEMPSLPVIAAGSLLEIALRQEEFSFPVGRVEFYHLGPMSFTEFLWATGNEILANKILEFDFAKGVDDQARRELTKFYYVGGMPKAVKAYVDNKSLVPVREVQEQIIQTYIADFPKYNNRIQLDRIERVFASTATHVGEKLIYQHLDRLSQSREIRRIVELLFDARVLLKCIHTDATSTPLAGMSDDSVVKIFFLDVGLLNAILNLSLEAIDSEMKNQFNTKGSMSEQFVAQHLALQNPTRLPQLFYWLKDKGVQKGDIDFILEHRNGALPIEVKSTSAGHLKSLFYYAHEKKVKRAIKISLEKFNVSTASYKIANETVNVQLAVIPQYAIDGIFSNLHKIFE